METQPRTLQITCMAVNEYSIILSKNKGNAQSAPNTNTPSRIHVDGGARRTRPREPTNPQDSLPLHHTPVAAIDPPQQPAPVRHHAYPPTPRAEIIFDNDSRCGPAVGNSVYSGRVRNNSDAVGALPHTVPPFF